MWKRESLDEKQDILGASFVNEKDKKSIFITFSVSPEGDRLVMFVRRRHQRAGKSVEEIIDGFMDIENDEFSPIKAVMSEYQKSALNLLEPDSFFGVLDLLKKIQQHAEEPVEICHYNENSRFGEHAGYVGCLFPLIKIGAAHRDDLESIIKFVEERKNQRMALFKKAYNHIDLIIKNYRNSEQDTEQKNIFDRLHDVLGNEAPPLDDAIIVKKIHQFSRELHEIRLEDRRISTTFLHDIFSALSLLFIVPGCIRAAISYHKFGTARFWKTECAQALQGMHEEVRHFPYEQRVGQSTVQDDKPSATTTEHAARFRPSKS